MAENAFQLSNLVRNDKGCDGLKLRIQRKGMAKNRSMFDTQE
jgi:hypothetical protein